MRVIEFTLLPVPVPLQSAGLGLWLGSVDSALGMFVDSASGRDVADCQIIECWEAGLGLEMAP